MKTLTCGSLTIDVVEVEKIKVTGPKAHVIVAGVGPTPGARLIAAWQQAAILFGLPREMPDALGNTLVNLVW